MTDAYVLITGSDDPFVTFTAENLTADGYAVRVATAPRAASIALSQPPLEAAVMADFEEPHSALALLRALRAGELEHQPVDCHLPAVLIGATDELGALRGFEAGADDVASREGSYPILRARLAALISRTRQSTALAALARIEGREIDADAGDVRYRGRPVRLSPLQHALLCHLATSPRRVFAVDELLRDVWGYETPVATTRTVAAHACRLRRSLQRVGGGHLVHTVRGRGYRLLAA